MTKPLNPRVTPLVDDPTQPSYVRELLEAGRNARVSGYDFEHGLSNHLGRIASGAPMPEWAESLKPAQAPAGGAAVAAGKSAIAWLLAPALAIVAGASVAILLRAPSEAPSAVAVPQASSVAPAAPSETAQRNTMANDRSGEAVASGSQAGLARHVPSSMPAPLATNEGSAGKERTTRPLALAKQRIVVAQAVSPRSQSRAVGSAVSPSPVTGMPSESAARVATTTSEAGALPAAQPEPARETASAAQPTQPAAQAQQPAAADKTQLDDARLEREMGMLSMTERVLKSDPARALRLARQGESEFAGSMFTQERQQLLLLALIELGRIDEAKRVAKPYLARFSKGPYSDRVRRALATGHVDP